MARPIITNLLDQAEQMLAASDRQVTRQQRIVEKLRAMGADTWGAQSLLKISWKYGGYMPESGIGSGVC